MAEYWPTSYDIYRHCVISGPIIRPLCSVYQRAVSCFASYYTALQSQMTVDAYLKSKKLPDRQIHNLFGQNIWAIIKNKMQRFGEGWTILKSDARWTANVSRRRYAMLFQWWFSVVNLICATLEQNWASAVGGGTTFEIAVWTFRTTNSTDLLRANNDCNFILNQIKNFGWNDDYVHCSDRNL